MCQDILKQVWGVGGSSLLALHCILGDWITVGQHEQGQMRSLKPHAEVVWGTCSYVPFVV